MRRTLLLLSIFLVTTLSGSAAEARRRPPPPPPQPQPTFQWDSRGWTMLGEQTVSGRIDRDSINVGRYEGRFSKLTLVVLDGDLELMDFTINFGDGTRYEPRVQHYFRENDRTRVIDLPPNGGVINRIDLKYRNLPGGARARVQVWGFKIAGGPGPGPGPGTTSRPVWDSRGWELLGEQTVAGRVDRDRITVGREMGKFSKLMVVVLDSDLEMIDMEVGFRRGQSFRPPISQFFREGTRTRAIDLPDGYRSAERTIEFIDFKYRNLPGGGRARVQVWGFQGGAAPAPAPGPVWDSRGWELLGEQTVAGRVDRDRITVGREMGRFSKLMVVVLDSDLEMIDMEVGFRRGQSFRPPISQYFREGTRTRAIDLPDGYRGAERTIEFIDFKYRNLPGGGRARVQVWGFQGGAAPAPPPPPPRPAWDSRGWELLGEQTVAGRVDRDRITVGREMGKFTRLMVVVLDGDLEMIDMEVGFRRGQSFRPAISQYFREGTRTRAIDLPEGYRSAERTIEFIDFKYRNLPGGGRARVQVWGQ